MRAGFNADVRDCEVAPSRFGLDTLRWMIHSMTPRANVANAILSVSFGIRIQGNTNTSEAGGRISSWIRSPHPGMHEVLTQLGLRNPFSNAERC